MPRMKDGRIEAPCALPALRCLGQPGAHRDEGPGDGVGQLGNQQRQAEKSPAKPAHDPAIFIGCDGRAAADRSQAGDPGEGEHHAGQQRQPAADEGLLGPGEDER